MLETVLVNNQPYTVYLENGEDGYIVASVPSLKGVISQGKTRAKARMNIIEAIELTLESLDAYRAPMPQCPTELDQ